MLDFTIIAHRGDSARAPENTLLSFEASVNCGFPHFETDCQLTSDGVCIVLHDERLGRTTAGLGGAVADTPWARLEDADAGSWFAPELSGIRIPTLQQVLDRYRDRVHLHLELKSAHPGLPAAVARELAACGWVGAAPPQAGGGEGQQPGALPSARTRPRAGDPGAPAFGVPGLTITSFHLQQLRRSLEVLPGVRHGWLVHDLSEEVVQAALDAGVQQLCPRANLLTHGSVRRATGAGLSVRAWGVRDLQLLYRAVGCGCGGATVNWPDRARAALAAPGAAEAAAEAAARADADIAALLAAEAEAEAADARA